MKKYLFLFMILSMQGIFAISIELSAFSGSSITVNWDTFPDGTTVGHRVAITNQYQSWGILLSSPETGDPLSISAASDAFSDPNLLAPPGLYSGTIVIEFVDPTTGLRSPYFTTLRAGTKIDPTCGGTSVTLKAYDYYGNLLGTDVGTQGTFIGIESTQRISYVSINGPNYTIDDFIYEPFSLGMVLPEMTTFLYSLLALSILFFVQWKKN